MKPFLFAMLLVVALFAGCKKFDADEQADLDEAIITQYITDNNLTATATASGLYYVIDSVGTGSFPTIDSTVTVAYSGYLPDGSGFDASLPAGATFPLTAVIKGWQEGIPLFREGGIGKLLIPSALGYGNTEVGDIPKNSVLIFDISLLNVE